MHSTGIKGLDNAITGLHKGDNVVWQVETFDDYLSFVAPFVQNAIKEKRKIVYIRFASHKPVIASKTKIIRYELDAGSGFETFTTQLHHIIAKEGRDTYYVFDCLSDLLPAWATDLMIGNFFMVTCPYLYELDTIAYFAILRDNHSYKTIARIRETTQLLMDVYHCDNICYVHPLKVWNRYSHTMFLPHFKDGENLVPITDSADAAKLLSHIREKGTEVAQRHLDHWDRLFIRATELLDPRISKEVKQEMFEYLTRIMITRDHRIMGLIRKHFSLEDFITIKDRLIGTGLIGGKTVGMLLARKILSHEKSINWEKVSEPHDSFYIGADVFYSFLVQNAWWKLRMEQKTKKGYFEVARVLREKMLSGKFPEEIREQFQQIIEYFGTSPIIVRSSSLLEDGVGNAFAGKYESIFCPNQGTPEERYNQFVDAVKRIYASTMSEEALNYRLHRGLDKRDEQMALLVQRVSGSYHGDYFLPDMAGVGISYNTYVWNEKIKAEDGMIRLVVGLGTRAVNREEQDYARVAALSDPLLRPYSDLNDIRRFSQHDVDLIDVKTNQFRAISFSKLMGENLELAICDYAAVKDDEITRQMEERGMSSKEYWILTFDKLFSEEGFIQLMQRILKTLEHHYHYPVDIEFTVNLTKKSQFKINLLQCRSLQTSGLGKRVELPQEVPFARILFKSKGYFLGGNISHLIHRIIYVRPEKYEELPLRDKYEVARIVGHLNKQIKDKEKIPTLLMGPGRWGTSTPSLGVPVSFFEINKIVGLVEIAFEGGNLVPELSFGTHFFQDLVESQISYLALFPHKDESAFNPKWLNKSLNRLKEVVPASARFSDVIGVYDVESRGLKLMADIKSQKVICFSKI